MSNGSAGTAAVSRGPRIALWLILLAALGFWIALAVRGGFLTIQAGGPVWLWALSIIVTTLLLVLAGHEINERHRRS
jgi:hypothetical protein